MSRENVSTLEIYEKYGEQYLEKRAGEYMEVERREMLGNCLAGLPKDVKIFEVGSAGGRDAKTIQSLGYKNVTVSDVADSFLGALKKEGFAPVKFNLIEDEFHDKYGFILCWAVLMHFTKDEAKRAIRKMFASLEDGGRLLFCVKKSDDRIDEWRVADFQDGAELYFSYWAEDELRECLEKTGFKTVKIWGYGSWLDCLAEK